MDDSIPPTCMFSHDEQWGQTCASMRLNYQQPTRHIVAEPLSFGVHHQATTTKQQGGL